MYSMGDWIYIGYIGLSEGSYIENMQQLLISGIFEDIRLMC